MQVRCGIVCRWEQQVSNCSLLAKLSADERFYDYNKQRYRCNRIPLNPTEATIAKEMPGMPAEVLGVVLQESSSVRSACIAKLSVSSRAAIGLSTHSIGIFRLQQNKHAGVKHVRQQHSQLTAKQITFSASCRAYSVEHTRMKSPP